MRWVEGLTLNRFVEDYLDSPQTFRQLLDLWPKLAQRLRATGLAHADLQHGNVLLVPTLGGQFSLKLIDYDGMYVPACAGRPSGELGHSAYQHPQRMREGTYNAEVDRFSHLVICSAVHALTVGLTFKPRELWERFNNGDNLLFRESDFARPQDSELFRLLWSVPNRELRAWVGRLALACQSRLEETALLGDVFSQGKVKPLTNEEARAAAALLRPPRQQAGTTMPEKGPEEPALQRTTAHQASPGAQVATEEENYQGGYRRVFMAVAMVVLLVGGVLGWRWYQQSLTDKARELATARKAEKRPVRKTLPEETIPVRRWTRPTGQISPRMIPAPIPLQIAKPPPKRSEAAPIAKKARPAATPLHLNPIARQTAVVGKELTLVASVERVTDRIGTVYTLGADAPPGATIDAQSGRFSWTPKEGPLQNAYQVTVSVRAADGRIAQTAFAIIVAGAAAFSAKTGSDAPPGQKPPNNVPPGQQPSNTITFSEPPTTVFELEVGKTLVIAKTVASSSPAADGSSYFLEGARLPPGATIDSQTGRFSWTPTEQQAGVTYLINAVSHAKHGSRFVRSTFSIHVSKPQPSEPVVLDKEVAIDLGRRREVGAVVDPRGGVPHGSIRRIVLHRKAGAQSRDHPAVLSGQVRGHGRTVGSGNGDQGDRSQRANAPRDAGRLERMSEILDPIERQGQRQEGREYAKKANGITTAIMGEDIQPADRGPMGVCLPSRVFNPLHLWRRRQAVGRLCMVQRQFPTHDASRGPEEAERMGLVRHARELVGMVPGLL